MEEQNWRKIALSLERPYLDDFGNKLPALFEITTNGDSVFEPKRDPATKLKNDFARIFAERGSDFFERKASATTHDEQDSLVSTKDNNEVDHDTVEAAVEKYMTHEDLFRMRNQIIPQLHVAMGEMSHAYDLLSLLLSSSEQNKSPPAQSLPHAPLSSSKISRQENSISVQAFNTRLAIGSKDVVLRKASEVLKAAAVKVHEGLERDEKYWSNALKIRKGNWGLVPAPSSIGCAFSKSSERTAKDFLVAFGLEDSPVSWLRLAVGQLQEKSSNGAAGRSIIFPYMERLRLRVSIANGDGESHFSLAQKTTSQNERESVDDQLKASQRAIVEQEIFSELIRLTGNVTTAPVHVSERLISIEAAQGINLKFEMTDENTLNGDILTAVSSGEESLCSLIHGVLYVLLVQTHTHFKARRLNSSSISHDTVFAKSSILLQPIIDVLQYQVFCRRTFGELSHLVDSLRTASIPTVLRFVPVADTGEQLLRWLLEDDKCRVTGEAVLRVGEKLRQFPHTIRFTFCSPSSLTAHLPQATVPVTSIPQLSQLLVDEVERALLIWICVIGKDIRQDLNSSWFVDPMMSRTVGRWESCALNFCVSCSSYFQISCIAYLFERGEKSNSRKVITYDRHEQGFRSWVEKVIEFAVSL